MPGEGSPPEVGGKYGKFLNASTATATLIGTALGIFVTTAGGLANVVISWIDHTSTTQIAEQKAHDEHVLIVYNAMTEALDKKDHGRQMLSLALGKALLSDKSDQGLLVGIFTVIGDHTDSHSVKVAADEQRFQAEQAEPPPAPPAAAPSTLPLGAYNVDSFWCESSGDAARNAADDVVGVVSAMTAGRVRERILPASRNTASAGYGISGVQVRFEAPVETGVADKLAAAIKAKIAADGIADAVLTHPVGFHTPNYVSVFVCPANPGN